MDFIIDVGNSNIVSTLFRSDNSKTPNLRFPTLEESSLYFERKILDYFFDLHVDFQEVSTISLSSVVPQVVPAIQVAIQSIFGKTAMQISNQSPHGLDIKIDHPEQLGTDLLANAVAAYDRFKQGVIVVDFGTALTFTSVSANREFLGVAIAPGLGTALKSLSANTAQLPEIEMKKPLTSIGKNTIHALRSGVFNGYIGLVRHMIDITKKEMQDIPQVIATGGLSHALEDLMPLFDEIDKDLTLKGIRMISQHM